MYSSYIGISPDFKSSVNLDYDLENIAKLNNYIFTSSVCECIEDYVDSVLYKDSKKASYIIGPYGKGKSYLMLILSFIFRKKNKDEQKVFEAIIKKIGLINPKLEKKIIQIQNEEKFLLPVIINGVASSTLSSCFFIALKRAVDTFINSKLPNAKEIETDNLYTVALKRIQSWEGESDWREIKKKCEKAYHTDFEEIKRGLEKYDSTALDLFKQLHLCISRGIAFNPLINEDIPYVFMQYVLGVKKYGYCGLFVIFDEFGAYIDGYKGNIEDDLLKLQRLCEKANSTGDEEQLHVVLIAHKDLKLYANESNGRNKDAFSKIEGRLVKRNLIKTFDEDVSLICGAKKVKNKKKYNLALTSHLRDSKEFYIKAENTQLFKDYNFEDIQESSFPFNPFALYALVYLSKIIGQNERTLFTFLNDTERYSFNDFISSCDYPYVLNTDRIYDYFEDLLVNCNQYKKIIVSVRSVILSCDSDEFARSVIKTLALLRVMDSPSFKPTRENIALCLFLISPSDTERLYALFNELIQKGYINESVLDKTLDFSTILSPETDSIVKKGIKSIGVNADFPKLLSSIIERKYIVSSEYNYKYKMTRYAEVVVFKSSVLKSLSDSKGELLSVTNADALVVLVINDDGSSEKELKDLEREYLAQSVVILPAKHQPTPDFYNKALIFASCLNLIKTKKLSDGEKNILDNYASGIKKELNVFIEDAYFYDLKDCARKLCSVLERFYDKTVIFNNETVNRHILTKTTTSALKKVIDTLLYSQSPAFSPLSQEATILRAYNRCIEGIGKSRENVIGKICAIFINNHERIEVKDLVLLLCNKEYGMRESVAALIMVTALSELTGCTSQVQNTVLFYYKNKEIDLNSDNILKAIYNPTDYSFEYQSVDNEAIEIVRNLEKALCVVCGNTNAMINRYAQVLKSGIQNKIYSLQNTILQTSFNDNVLKLSDVTIAFKNLFLQRNINCYDLIFKKLFDTIGNVAAQAFKNTEIIKQELNTSVNNYEKSLIERVKNAFAPCGSASIKTAFDMFVNNTGRDAYDFTNLQDEALYKALKKCTYNDKQTLNEMLSSCIHTTTDDMNTKKEARFFECVKHLKLAMRNENTKIIKSDAESLSPVAGTLKNNLTEMINSYGMSVTNSEKIAILNSIIREIK